MFWFVPFQFFFIVLKITEKAIILSLILDIKTYLSTYDAVTPFIIHKEREREICGLPPSFSHHTPLCLNNPLPSIYVHLYTNDGKQNG